MKILFVNGNTDDKELLHFLNKGGMKAEYADSFRQVFSHIDDARYDAIVLDIANLSRLDSCFTFLEKMSNENRKEGLVVISAQDDLEQRLKLFELGADDVVTPKCHPSELVTRIRTIIKRKNFNTRNKLYFANLVIYFEERSVYVWNNPIDLTKKEYEILLHLIANKNRVLTKESLAGYLWSDYSEKSDSFDFLFTHIKNLRKKLLTAKAELIIKNIYGVGYQIEEL